MCMMFKRRRIKKLIKKLTATCLDAKLTACEMASELLVKIVMVKNERKKLVKERLSNSIMLKGGKIISVLIISETMRFAKYFAYTIWRSDIGRESKNIFVFCFFSSTHTFIVSIGIKIEKRIGTDKK